MFIPYPHDLITYSGSDFLREHLLLASEVISILDEVAKLDITENERLEVTEKILKKAISATEKDLQRLAKNPDEIKALKADVKNMYEQLEVIMGSERFEN